MDVRILAGATVHVCALCGAHFGDRRGVAVLAAGDEARVAGVDAVIWPLAKILGQVEDLELERAEAGSAEHGTLPAVELIVSGTGALVQLENLAKALRLAAGSLRCRWGIEVRYEHALTLAVGARPGGRSATLRDARIDIEVLARHLDRDMRLSWWRHANHESNG